MSAVILGPPLAALFVATAILTTAAATAVATRVTGFSSSRSLAFVGLGPLIAALVTCLALLSPALGAECHCVQHGLHHPHLCPAHPMLASVLVAPSAYALLAWLMFVSPQTAQLARDVVRTARFHAAVRRAPLRQIAGRRAYLAPCGNLGAVTLGLFRPVIVMDPAVWTGLTEQEREAVVGHEAGHAARRDTLTLLLLRAWYALCPLPSLRAVIARWRTSAEFASDQHAARSVGDGCVVASALLSVERIRARLTDAESPAGVLAVSGGAGLEGRVRALVSTKSPRGAAFSDLIPVLVVAVTACAAVIAVPGDHAHHAVETVLGLILSAK